MPAAAADCSLEERRFEQAQVKIVPWSVSDQADMSVVPTLKTVVG